MRSCISEGSSLMKLKVKECRMIRLKLGERKIGIRNSISTVILNGELELGAAYIIDILRRLEETKSTNATIWIPSPRVRKYLERKNIVRVMNARGDCSLPLKTKKGKILVTNPATSLKTRIQRLLKEEQNASEHASMDIQGKSSK